MRNFTTRLKRILVTGHTQAVFFAGLVAITALAVAWHTPGGSWLRSGSELAHANPPATTVNASDITLHAELSQTKLVQGQNGALYVNLGIQTPAAPEAARAAERAPIDMVVVLDRSPSMMADNKWPLRQSGGLGAAATPWPGGSPRPHRLRPRR